MMTSRPRRASRTIAARLHKLTGQLAAVERMVGNRRPCTDVLTQVEAVRAGLASVAAIVLNEELARLSRKRALDPREILRLTKVFIANT